MPIDATTYSKLRWPVGHGYGPLRSSPASALVVHSTNGRKGSTFAAEATYLRDSINVSAHFLIGKDGAIVQFLPSRQIAWHAGNALGPFRNEQSIGIECHHAVGDTWPAAQLDGLALICRQMIAAYHLREDRIETHRHIALPRGRKVDPSDWPDALFYAWRSALFTELA